MASLMEMSEIYMVLEKPVMHEIHISGTVVVPHTNA